MRRETRVSIYERVKYGTKWRRQRVQIPLRKANGGLYLKDDRRGVFQLSWYEERQKQWQNVKGRVSENELPFLSDAITQAKDKSWFLNNRDRRVYDPTTDVVERKKLSVEVPRYLEAKSGCKKTVSAHEHAVREFLEWAKKPKRGRGLVYVDEISKALLRRFFEYLVDGDEDDDGPANHPFTAAFKVMRVTRSFARYSVLSRGRGQSPRKTTSANSRAAEFLRSTPGKIWTRCSRRWMTKSTYLQHLLREWAAQTRTDAPGGFGLNQ